MADQCKHCELRGDIGKCLSADCFHHENWYSRQQQETIDFLRRDAEMIREGEAIVIPKNREHAERMALVAARFLEDNPQ